MRILIGCLLFGAAIGRAAPVPGTRPSFLAMETPWQMAGQAGGGLLGALVVGMVGAGIGSDRARQACLEETDPDLSDECGWSGLSGGVAGFGIGATLGHALGTLGAGLIQGKHGAPLAALSAVAGDVGLFYLAVGLHDALDGKVARNGVLDKYLIPMAFAGMVAIPIATQSIWDYRVRIALEPGVAMGASSGDARYLLRFAQVRF